MENNNKQIKNIVILVLSIGVLLLSVYVIEGLTYGRPTDVDAGTQDNLYSNENITKKVKQVAPTYEQCYDREDGSTICCIPVGQKKNSSKNTVLCDHFEMLETDDGKLFIIRQTQ